MLDINRYDGHLWISGIQSTERNKGFATIIMQKIVEIADKYQIYCGLSAEPYTNIKYKDILTASQLKKWYRKFGFKSVKGDTSKLERAPQSTQKIKEPKQIVEEPKQIVEEPKQEETKGNNEIDTTYTHFAIYLPKKKIVTHMNYLAVNNNCACLLSLLFRMANRFRRGKFYFHWKAIE